jgi:hypothetical protein
LVVLLGAARDSAKIPAAVTIGFTNPNMFMKLPSFRVFFR